jgi:hypothetical protein
MAIGEEGNLPAVMSDRILKIISVYITKFLPNLIVLF